MKKTLTIILLSLFVHLCLGQTISALGKRFIKGHEGLSLTAYRDAHGMSIGYGHYDERLQFGDSINMMQADSLFESDVRLAEGHLLALCSETLCYPANQFPQHFWDALVDLIYNNGKSNTRESLFWQRIRRCRPVDKELFYRDIRFSMVALLDGVEEQPEGVRTRRIHEFHAMELDFPYRPDSIDEAQKRIEEIKLNIKE